MFGTDLVSFCSSAAFLAAANCGSISGSLFSAKSSRSRATDSARVVAGLFDNSFAFAISLPIIEPVAELEPPAPPSRPTPVRAPVPVASSVRAPISSAVIAGAALLIVIGVATLAAAIGVFASWPTASVSVESEPRVGATSVGVAHLTVSRVAGDWRVSEKRSDLVQAAGHAENPAVLATTAADLRSYCIYDPAVYALYSGYL